MLDTAILYLYTACETLVVNKTIVPGIKLSDEFLDIFSHFPAVFLCKIIKSDFNKSLLLFICLPIPYHKRKRQIQTYNFLKLK